MQLLRRGFGRRIGGDHLVIGRRGLVDLERLHGLLAIVANDDFVAEQPARPVLFDLMMSHGDAGQCVVGFDRMGWLRGWFGQRSRDVVGCRFRLLRRRGVRRRIDVGSRVSVRRGIRVEWIVPWGRGRPG